MKKRDDSYLFSLSSSYADLAISKSFFPNLNFYTKIRINNVQIKYIRSTNKTLNKYKLDTNKAYIMPFLGYILYKIGTKYTQIGYNYSIVNNPLSRRYSVFRNIYKVQHNIVQIVDKFIHRLYLFRRKLREIVVMTLGNKKQTEVDFFLVRSIFKSRRLA